MGQYDLKTLLSDDRLAFLVTDLKGIAKRETKESRPLFLLAYIAYNTGNERRAAAYLDLAEKRADGKDPFFALIRKHWALPAEQAPAAPDVLNK
jgi:cytochrome c-type biogenesis protein CcmH/NrfG